MIARNWHGRVPSEKTEAYHQYLLKTGLKEYASIKGNRGTLLFKRNSEDGITHFDTLTFWDNIEAIKRFTGEDYEKAKYYPEDKGFLLEFEELVTHYKIVRAQIRPDNKF